MNLEQKITDYITRYIPSRKKLEWYIARKSYALIPSEVITKIGYDESLMIDIWMRSFISMGKWERMIRQKLLLKAFKKEDIERSIQSHADEIYNWSEYESNIEEKIENLHARGKTKMQIGILLIGAFPYFRSEIEELLSGVEDWGNLQKEWTKLKRKYNVSDRKEQQKALASLLRKGYTYDEIKRLMKVQEENE